MRQDPYKLQQILEPVVAAMGYELVGVEFQLRKANTLLRLYIDQDAGINLEDCERVSHQVSGVLDVEDRVSGQYTLEVSSPGLDRPLFQEAHFARFVGHRARIHLVVPINGKNKLVGLLKSVQDGEVAVEVEGVEIRVPLDRIDKARLVPELEIGKKRRSA